MLGIATLVIGASTAVPTRLARAEALLTGKHITLELAQEAGEIAAQDMEAISQVIEELVDYTRRDNVAERLAKRFGASIGEGAVRALKSAPSWR